MPDELVTPLLVVDDDVLLVLTVPVGVALAVTDVPATTDVVDVDVVSTAAIDAVEPE